MDPYETLGVAPTNDMTAIKTAYQQALLQHHPDKCAGGNVGHSIEKFHQVQDAWKLLSDRTLKSELDMRRKQQSARCGVNEVDLEEFQMEQCEIEVEVEEEVTRSDGSRGVKVTCETALVDMYVRECRCGDRFEIVADEISAEGNSIQCNSCSLSIFLTKACCVNPDPAAEPTPAPNQEDVVGEVPTPEFPALLAALAANEPALTAVNLDDRGLQDEEVVSLCAALAQNTQVSELSLARNCFSTVGLVSIAKLISRPSSSLTRLDLSHNRLEAAGVAPLARAISISSTRLAGIQLRNCGPEAGAVLMAFMQRPCPAATPAEDRPRPPEIPPHLQLA